MDIKGLIGQITAWKTQRDPEGDSNKDWQTE